MKRVINLIILCMCFCCLTACFKRDNFEGIDIYTTVYPVEYITERLYGENSEIHSIYPNGVNVNEYKLNEKQIKDYSSTALFIFNGLNDEREYVKKFFKHNKDLKIIDVTASMENLYGDEELWLNPSNYLMMIQNIRYGLKEYINNHYLKNQIDENYNILKEEISKLDADIYEISNNTNNKTIVVSSDVFKFLEKYDLEVISLEENDSLNEKTILNVINLIKNDKIHYIFLKQGEEISTTVQRVIDETGVEVIYFHTITNLTGEERNAKKDYISLMSDNINLLRNELYD